MENEEFSLEQLQKLERYRKLRPKGQISGLFLLESYDAC